MTAQVRKVLATDSGMWAIWEPDHFTQVVDYATWENELLEDDDILRHIKDHTLVPINLHFDGAYEFELRAGDLAEPAMLSNRETNFVSFSSDFYQLKILEKMCVSGIEHIGRLIDNQTTACVVIPQNTYSVSIHMIEWDREEGSKDVNGNPTPKALPDFIILANPLSPGSEERYCESLETFPKHQSD